jgi:hypothetical protein
MAKSSLAWQAVALLLSSSSALMAQGGCAVLPFPTITLGAGIPPNECTTTISFTCTDSDCEGGGCGYAVTSVTQSGNCCPVIGIIDNGFNVTWMTPGTPPGGPGAAAVNGLNLPPGTLLQAAFVTVTSEYCGENALDEPFPGDQTVTFYCDACF